MVSSFPYATEQMLKIAMKTFVVKSFSIDCICYYENKQLVNSVVVSYFKKS